MIERIGMSFMKL